MNILVINVYETDGASVVEFVGEGEEKITVCLDGLKSASRNELLQQAVTSCFMAFSLPKLSLE